MNIEKKFMIIPLLVFFAAFSVLFVACGSDEEETSKSMQQIHAEDGIPVVVEQVQLKPFMMTLSFFSKLSGIKEAIEGAAVGGRIEKINVKVGDYVKKGDVVMEFPKDAVAIQYEQAKSAFEIAEKNYNRMKALLEAGEISQANFDGVETQYLVAKRNFETQKQMMFVEAPFDGVVTSIMINEGDNVSGKAPLFSVVQMNKMRTRVWVTEDEIGLIKNGMDAFIEYQGKKYSGKVVEKSIAMDPMKQAYYVEAEFNNPNKELKSGPTVDVQIVVYRNNEAVIVPRNLIKADEKGQYIFVEKEGAAEKRYVTNGKGSGIEYEISSGLNIGDNLIVKGSANLVNGTKVKVTQ